MLQASGLTGVDRVWYITIVRTHPKVPKSKDVFLVRDSWPPRATREGGIVRELTVGPATHYAGLPHSASPASV